MTKQFDFSRVFWGLLIVFSLISGFALTIFGLNELSWPQSIVWSGKNTLLRFFGFLAVAGIVISLLAWRLQRNTGLAVLLTVVLLAVVAGATWPLLVTLWFAGASSLLGHWLLERLEIKSDNLLNSFLVGAGFYGTAVGLLAHYPVNYSGVYGAALALPLVLGWRAVLDKRKSLFIGATKTNQDKLGVNWLDVSIGVIALVYVVVALMPEVGFDSLVTHLFIPAHLAQRHQWGFDASTYVWAVTPMLGDWIFSVGYLLAGETAVRLINVGFIFILGGLLCNMTMWAGGTVLGARWAVLIFLTTPLTFTEGSSLYIESVWASFVVAGAFAVLNSCLISGESRIYLPIAGILLGCALAAKAVTFTILPVLLLLLLWRYKLWSKNAGLQVLMLGIGLFLVIGCIPYVTAWRLTGNPIFPLFNNIFQSPYYSITENFNNQLYSSGVTWDFIYRVTFESGKYLEAVAGASGFQWLLLFIPTLIALIAFRQFKGLALLLVGVLPIVITFQAQSYLRYVFPSWVILMAPIGVAISTAYSVKSFNQKWWCAAAVFTVILNVLFINAGNAFYRDFPLKSIFDQTGRDEYLMMRLPIRNAVELVNRLNIEKTPVAVFADPLMAGLSGDALYTSWYNVAFNKEIASVQSEQDLANILLKRGVKFIILNSSWNGLNCCSGGLEKQDYIEKISLKIAEYGSISIRKIKSEYQFKTELLSSSDFTSMKGWSFSAGVKYDADNGVLLVSEADPVVQTVNVSPGGHYLNTVRARCAEEPTPGRVQINWLDIKGRIVNTDIKIFGCSPIWTEHTMEVTAPSNAEYAVVFVTGHTKIPLEFKSNSLRQ